jgi:hypothetical protein
VKRATVTPIAAADLQQVGAFLHQHLNRQLSSREWATAADAPWSAESPNHGFMLVNDEAGIVGVYLAFYSERSIGGRVERFCNLGAWCVLPDYRAHSIYLLRALLKQRDYHFTDLSPSGHAVLVNARLKFRGLDTATALLVNIPWPSWLCGGGRITSDRHAIERLLAGPEVQIYRDHVHAKAAHHVVLQRAREHCYVIFRRDRRKNLPLFASVLYVSHPELFCSMARAFGWHLLRRHGVLATLLERRICGEPPAGCWRLAASRPKMFRSDSLSHEQIDNLYSELVCVAW